MSNCWWLILTSCLGGASLQYISSGGPEAGNADNFPLQSNLPPLPYANIFNLPPFEAYSLPNTEEHSQFYKREDQDPVERKKRDISDVSRENWLPNMVDKDKTVYYPTRNAKVIASPFIVEGFGATVNGTDYDMIRAIDKRNFSPWGGKRSYEQTWAFKRNSFDQKLPKRFSPWGGKRSGQILYPGSLGSKSSKMIFSTTVPELKNVITNYTPERSFHFIPILEKRHPIEILALKIQNTREALPFKQYLDNQPKSFKLGQTYSNINLKKDGKRKMKFSSWGGKRSPIIGPIWTPQQLKTARFNAFLLMHDARDKSAMQF